MCRERVLSVLFLLCVAVLPASAQRLPTHVIPEHYVLKVAPDLASATFAGEEEIRVRLAQPSASIALNSAEITFRTVEITAGGTTQPATIAADEQKEQVTFTVRRPIPAGGATVRVSYTGVLNDQLRGLYLSKANNRRYAVTQMEATDARRMFPCFDEPAFKATYDLTVTIDAGDHAISNGDVVSDTPGPGAGKHTVTFATTPKMSTYLVALAVGDFECISGGADGVPIRMCATPDKKGLTGFALESAEEIMRYYNRYFGLKYPFKKLDVVAVPDFSAGAMENTAAIFYRETLLLADPTSSSVGTRKAVAGVLAHEMAHQWFGDLVTMAWWDDIWLNEGFANWMATKPLKAWKPGWHVELDEVQSNQAAMGLDALRSTRPLRAKANTPAEISELFDAIAYEKGAAVLRMVESYIGEDAFRAGVNAYVQKFQYSNARAEDFWSTMTRVTGKPVDRIMSTFVEQPGVPLVSIDSSCQGNSTRIALIQQRYVRDASTRGAAGAQAWTVPVCVRLADGRTSCELLDAPRGTLAPHGGCSDWEFGNAGGRGYYRVEYSSPALKALAAHVAALAPGERIALLSDQWALVRAGRDVGTFLGLASGFGPEREAAPMQTLTNTLRTIGEEATTLETVAAYRQWVSRLLTPAMRDVGWEAAADETDNTRALRATLVYALGDTARDPGVLADARTRVEQVLGGSATIEPTLLDAIVPIAAINGDAALYDKYLTRARETTAPEEHYRWLYALGAFSDPALVRRTMDLILSTEVRNQDAKVFLAVMLVNQDSHALAWNLLKARFDEVQKKTGEFVGNTVFVGALASFCSAVLATDMRAFFATHPVPDAERTLQQSLERISGCVELHDAQHARLAAWLRPPGSR